MTNDTQAKSSSASVPASPLSPNAAVTSSSSSTTVSTQTTTKANTKPVRIARYLSILFCVWYSSLVMTVRILFQSVRILEKFVHSAPCVKKYLAIDSGGCLCENEFVLHQQDDLVLPTDLVWCLID